jgi:hypothetical protein
MVATEYSSSATGKAKDHVKKWMPDFACEFYDRVFEYQKTQCLGNTKECCCLDPKFLPSLPLPATA